MANWPDQKDQPEYWEEIEKEQKTEAQLRYAAVFAGADEIG